MSRNVNGEGRHGPNWHALALEDVARELGTHPESGPRT